MQKLRELTTKQKVLLIIGLGLLVRLVLMPFFGHEDIFLTNSRAYSVAFEGVNLFSFNQQISHFIEVVNLQIYSIFFDHHEMLPFSAAASENAYVLRHLFVFKIPYLIFDLIAAWLVFKVAPGKHRLYSLAFYFLNPILIFAVYMFGRYETFPIVFLLLVLLLMKKHKLLWSALVMGLTIPVRSSMLMVMPFYWATVGRSWREKITAIVVSVIPYLALLAYQIGSVGTTNELEWVADGSHTNFVLGLSLNINEVIHANFYPFVAVYGILLFAAFQLWQQKQQSWKLTAAFFGMGFALYYTLGYYHPQYMAWIIPFIALLLMDAEYRKQTLWIFGAVTAAFPFMLLLWGQPILMGIFTPLSEWLGSKDLGGVIGHYYDQFKLADLARSFMGGMFAIMLISFARKVEVFKNFFTKLQIKQ